MCEQSNLHFKEDQVSTLSKYLKREVICKSSNTSISSEAFSGGGAWDEDDEKVEMYETHSSLHQASKLIESSDKELDEMLHLAFGNVAFISTDNIIQSNYLPNDHFPKKVIGCTHVEISRPKLTSSTDKQEKYFDHRLEGIDEKTASAALKGFMPFAEDPEKQTRYIRYLRFCNGKSRKADDPKSGLYLDEKEHEEFIMSAQIFKPSSSLISSRFESSSTSLQPQITLKAGLSRPDSLKKLAPPRETEMPQIQKMNTKTNQSFPSRTTFIWMPASLLCKRFNVSPPETGFPSTVEPKKVKPALADESIEQLVNTLVKDSKHRFQLESSESRKNEKSEEEIPLLPSNDMFEEIFGPSSSENSEKRNRPKATDYFGSS